MTDTDTQTCAPNSCAQCGVALPAKATSGYCRTHYHWKYPRAACGDCGARLGRNNRSGFCRTHSAQRLVSTDAFRAAHREGLRRHFADPANLARARATMAENRTKGDAKAKRAATVKRLRLWEKGQAAQPKGSEPRMRAGRSLSETWIAWCPVRYRDDYRHMVKVKRLPMHEAKAIIADMVERDLINWRASVGLPVDGMGEPVGDEARFVAELRSMNCSEIPNNLDSNPDARHAETPPRDAVCFADMGAAGIGGFGLPKVQLPPRQMGRAAA